MDIEILDSQVINSTPTVPGISFINNNDSNQVRRVRVENLYCERTQSGIIFWNRGVGALFEDILLDGAVCRGSASALSVVPQTPGIERNLRLRRVVADGCSEVAFYGGNRASVVLEDCYSVNQTNKHVSDLFISRDVWSYHSPMASIVKDSEGIIRIRWVGRPHCSHELWSAISPEGPFTRVAQGLSSESGELEWIVPVQGSVGVFRIREHPQSVP